MGKKFQSLIGTLQTLSSVSPSDSSWAFQSLIGTLQTGIDGVSMGDHNSFNLL